MRGKRLTAIGVGLVLSAGSACSLLTKLDAPTDDTPDAPDAPKDGSLADAGGIDAGSDASRPRDSGAGADVCIGIDAPNSYYAGMFVAQSFPLATSALTMVEGQVIPSYITLQNSGTTSWESTTQLVTTAPRGRVSVFADGTWASTTEPAAVKGTIAMGSSFKFPFDLRAPQMAGTYFEHFGLVDVRTCPPIYFGDPGQGGPADDDIEVQIVVVAPQYRGTFLTQSFPSAPATMSVAKGAVVSGWFELTNTGTQPWKAGTTKLAPIPRDVDSPFADSSWLSPTRISTLPADVAPGDVGEFQVKLDANDAGTFTVEFGLVEDGVTWFSDPTLGGGPADGFLRVDLIVGSLDGGGTD